MDEVARLVAAVREAPGRSGELVPLLSDAHRVHRERGALEVIRVRGFVMQTFADVGLPDHALPHVLEDLESSRHAYAVAAAARALRGWARPSTSVEPLLQRALRNIAGKDDYVSFADLDAEGGPEEGTTATAELERTLAWLSARTEAHLAPPPRAGVDVADDPPRPWASCCDLPEAQRGVRRIAPSDRAPARDVLAIELQDQHGITRSYEALFVGRPTIVAFFYTRCDNPRKCSLTIAKLARVQRLLQRRGLSDRIGLAAVSYEPAFDTAERLKAYGDARGFSHAAHHHLLRTPSDEPALRAYFELGVGYVHSAVNRHRIELVVLDVAGRPAVLHQHLEWDERSVVDDAAGLLPQAVDDAAATARHSTRAAVRGIASSVPSLALALVPKCPACWAAYLSAFGIASLGHSAAWLVPVLAALVLVNLGATWFRARRTRRWLPFGLAAAGALALLPLGLVLHVPGALAAGALLTLAASVLGAAPRAFALTLP